MIVEHIIYDYLMAISSCTIKLKWEAFKMRIYKAEDFGVAFNILAREYRRTADSELLKLMNKTCDKYLPYFSIRTLSCAVRDLQMPYTMFGEPTFPKDEDDFEFLQKRLLQYYLSRKMKQRPVAFDLRNLLTDVAMTCYMTKDRFGENARFENIDAFILYVRDNGLLEIVEYIDSTDDILPFDLTFQKDFASICNYMQRYSFGRQTYMPSLTADFIRANAEIFHCANDYIG